MKTSWFISNRSTKAGLALCALMLFAITPTVTAENLSVGATIPYDPPTQAAVIDSSVEGTTVQDALFTLHGTCQLMSPVAAVTIIRNNQSIGSTVCNGSFSLQIMLSPGVNDLIARTANASQLYGPDSQQVTVTLQLPAVIPTPPAPSSEPTTPAAIAVAANNAAVQQLMSMTVEPFSVMNNSSNGTAVTVHVVVGGGEHPYDVTLDWGDGSVEVRTVDQAGTYEFTHTYQAAGNYVVQGKVHDVLGAETRFQYAILTSVKIAAPSTVGVTKAKTGTGSTVIIGKGVNVANAAPYISATGGLIVAGLGYWLGLHRTFNRAAARRLERMQNYRADKLKPKKIVKVPRRPVNRSAKTKKRARS